MTSPGLRVVVLVPAHDEAATSNAASSTLREQDYPSELYEIVVDRRQLQRRHRGDRCRRAASPCWSGTIPPPLGRAARCDGRSTCCSRRDPTSMPSMVVDADSVAEPHLVSGLAARLAERSGRRAGRVPRAARRRRSSIRAAVGLDVAVPPGPFRRSGRARPAVPSRRERHGVQPAAARGAPLGRVHERGRPRVVSGPASGRRPARSSRRMRSLRAPIAKGGAAARTQRIRWEGGRAPRDPHAGAASCCAPCGTATGRSLDAVVELLVPPLGVLAVGSVVGAAAAAVLWFGSVSCPVGAGAVARGLRGVSPCSSSAGCGPGGRRASTYRALAAAPLLVLGDTRNRLRLLRGTRAGEWHRTERPGEQRADRPCAHRRRPGRSRGSGRPRSTTPWPRCDERRFMQICTVNLDFVVNARRNEAVRSVLSQSEMNLADGKPGALAGTVDATAASRARRRRGFRAPARRGRDRRGRERVLPRRRRRGRGSGGGDLAGHATPGSGSPGCTSLRVRRWRTWTTARSCAASTRRSPTSCSSPSATRSRTCGSPPIVTGCRSRSRSASAAPSTSSPVTAGGRRRGCSEWASNGSSAWPHEPARLAKRYAIDGYWLLAVLVPLSLQQRIAARRALEPVAEGSTP